MAGMGKSGMVPAGCALLIALIAGVPAEAGAPANALFLHYRWYKDGTIRLVDRQTIPARLKPSRSAAREGRQADVGRPPLVRAFAPTPGGAALTYALLSARGDVLSETALPDPGKVRVEIQEPGESQLRCYETHRDSGDIFLRIGEAEAKSIRFFKWLALVPAPGPGPAVLPKPSPGAAERAGETGPGGGAAAVKTLIAEFALQ